MIRQVWRVVGGDVRVAVDEAEWWGASLAVLIAAVHHPGALATRQPATDPADIARKVLAEVAELYAAAAIADAQVQHAEVADRPVAVSVRREEAEIVFAPGGEVANLAWCIEVFATAVLDPSGPDAMVARGDGIRGLGVVHRHRQGVGHPRCYRAGRRGMPMTGRHQLTAGEVGEPTRHLPLGIGSRSPMDAALAYGAAGWPVLPVAGVSAGECACKRSCESLGKHPLTRHGVYDATTDPVLIGEWWDRSPGANVGIATGVASGLVVVDLDLPKGGRESLQALDAAGFSLTPTLASHTGGGGMHLFYAQPAGVAIPNAVGRLPGLVEALPGIDLRGDGGYVVVPPSVHISGRRYRWDRRRIVGMPAWIWPKPKDGAPAVAAFPPTAGASAYGAAALSGELESVRGLLVGQRNDGLNRAAFCLGRLVGGGELSEALVAEALLCAAIAIGLAESEAESTIRSGLRAGMALPRRAPNSPAWRSPVARAATPRSGPANPTPLRGREGVPDVDPAS